MNDEWSKRDIESEGDEEENEETIEKEGRGRRRNEGYM